MDLPFDGGISRFARDDAPKDVRKAVKHASKSNILNPDFPYDERWEKDDYETALAVLQIELVRMQAWARDTGQRIAIVVEWPLERDDDSLVIDHGLNFRRWTVELTEERGGGDG